MGRVSRTRSTRLAALAVAAMACAQGCTFLRARGKDALDMFDVGFTFSTKPQFGIYANCPFTVPGGYSNVEGYFVGLGGGKFGVMDHHQKAAGILFWGAEDVEWSKGEDDEQKLGKHQIGPLGLVVDEQGNTSYRPQCAHYLHLGFLGVTGNLNYREWADYFTGWVGMDMNKDDWRAEALPVREQRIHDISARIARTRDGLQLFIRTDKETYKPDEPIVLDVQLINRSRASRRSRGQDLAVYFEPFAATPQGGRAEWQFKFHVFEVYGSKARYRSPRFEVPPEEREAYYHYVSLPPSAFVGRRFVFPAANERGWLPPGDYFFMVSYEVSDEYPYIIITPELTAAQATALGTDTAYTRLWTGKLYSNLVVFSVRRPRFLGIF